MAARAPTTRAASHEPSERRHSCKRCRRSERTVLPAPSMQAAPRKRRKRAISSIPLEALESRRQLQRGRWQMCIAEVAQQFSPDWIVSRELVNIEVDREQQLAFRAEVHACGGVDPIGYRVTGGYAKKRWPVSTSTLGQQCVDVRGKPVRLSGI